MKRGVILVVLALLTSAVMGFGQQDEAYRGFVSSPDYVPEVVNRLREHMVIRDVTVREFIDRSYTLPDEVIDEWREITSAETEAEFDERVNRWRIYMTAVVGSSAMGEVHRGYHTLPVVLDTSVPFTRVVEYAFRVRADGGYVLDCGLVDMETPVLYLMVHVHREFLLEYWDIVHPDVVLR